jgi:hypothetical protein
MGVQITKKVFEIADAGLHNAKIVRTEDLGPQEGGKYGTKEKVLIVFECLDQQDAEGKNVEVWGRFTQSIGEKSMLGKLLAALHITPGDTFDTDDLLGSRVQLVVVHSDDGKYANIETFIPLKAGKPPAPTAKVAVPVKALAAAFNPAPKPVAAPDPQPVEDEDIPF